MKRLGLEVSIEELDNIMKELRVQQAELCYQLKMPVKIERTRRQMINIINKTKSKDTWEIEK